MSRVSLRGEYAGGVALYDVWVKPREAAGWAVFG